MGSVRLTRPDGSVRIADRPTEVLANDIHRAGAYLATALNAERRKYRAVIKSLNWWLWFVFAMGVLFGASL